MFGWNSATSGTTYGLYGACHSGAGYGMYATNHAGGWAGGFDGSVRIMNTGGAFLVIDDTNGGNDRPGIQFANNSTQWIAGDDQEGA